MAHVRLQPIQRQNPLLLVLQPLLQPLGIREMERQQFFIPIELIAHGALGHVHTSPHQFLVDLWDTALLLVPQPAYQRHHVQPEFPMRQCPSSFFLGPTHTVEPWARAIGALVDRSRVRRYTPSHVVTVRWL